MNIGHNIPRYIIFTTYVVYYLIGFSGDIHKTELLYKFASQENFEIIFNNAFGIFFENGDEISV